MGPSVENNRTLTYSGDRLLTLPEIVAPRGIIPISRSGFYQRVKSGDFPAPIRMFGRSFWTETQIHELLARIRAGEFDKGPRRKTPDDEAGHGNLDGSGQANDG
jgi:prophage regulatory protein